MKFHFKHAGQVHTIELLPHGGAAWRAVADGQVAELSLQQRSGDLELAVNGKLVRAAWARQGRTLWLHLGGHSYALERIAGGRGGASAAGAEDSLRAPMPGQVRKVLVKAGQSVTAGTVLVLLEAMKMEVRIQASQDAKVAHIAVIEGQTVEKDQLLVELEPEHVG